MSTPFDRTASSIPVTVITGRERALLPLADDIAVLRMEPSPHDHEPGGECIACAARGDIRALLFDLLTEARQGRRPTFSAVLVDASQLDDAKPVVDRLERGTVPAVGLRDHTVARSFHLSRVL